MGDKYLTLSEFNLEGQFLGFVGDSPAKYQYLRLALPSGDVQIKIPKDLRLSAQVSLVPGEQIRVCGTSKLNSHTGKIKLRASGVAPVAGCPNQTTQVQPKAKILVCQKSGCTKRGGKGFLSELEKTLGDRGLSEHVTIEYTGCMKCCGSAPNCVLQIGKKEYKKMHPEAIASLLENHFNCKSTCH